MTQRNDKEDFITEYDTNLSARKIGLYSIRTYHKEINGTSVFVYNLKHRGMSHGWVCIDCTTGACIDNVVQGHRTKKDAFESATIKYAQYSKEAILKAQQKVLKRMKGCE